MGEMGKVYRGELPAEAIRPPPPKPIFNLNPAAIQPDQESMMATFDERRRKDDTSNQSVQSVSYLSSIHTVRLFNRFFSVCKLLSSNWSYRYSWGRSSSWRSAFWHGSPAGNGPTTDGAANDAAANEQRGRRNEHYPAHD